MYRVLIADDEHLVCALLKKLIHWDELGLALLGTAADGLHAWEMIRQERPEIVIADIRMPGMDGLEMAHLASERDIGSNFILISGHTEFTYAFHAIKYGVEDYLIKPIDEQELNAVLGKICEKRAAKERHTRNDALLKISLHKIQTDYLRRVIRGESVPQDLAEFNGNAQTAFAGGRLRVIAVRLGALAIRQEADKNLLYEKAQEIVLSVFSGWAGQAVCAVEGKSLFCVADYPPGREEEFAAACRMLLDELFTRMNLYQHCTVTLAVSKAAGDVRELGSMAGQAAAGTCARLSAGENQLIWCETLPVYACHTAVSDMALEELQGCAEACDPHRLMLFVNRILSTILYAEMSDWDRMQEIRRFLSAFFRIIGREGAEDAACERMEFCTAYPEICTVVNETVEQAYGEYLERLQAKTVHPVHQAQQYIREHLEGELTLEQVAAQVYLNPVYFSSLFKNETGVNFSKYVAAERVSRAKEYLLDPRLSIEQVAVRVGYKDKKHFSKLFKKVAGITPSDYRKLHL